MGLSTAEAVISFQVSDRWGAPIVSLVFVTGGSHVRRVTPRRLGRRTSGSVVRELGARAHMSESKYFSKLQNPPKEKNILQ